MAEAGAVRIRNDANLTVGRGAPGEVELITAGTEVTLGPGESALVPALASGEVGSAGEGPAEVLVVRVQPAVAAPPQVG